ncbi:hypothetical protein ACFSKL_03205 [Belliella marina]|uniref:Uncharacterized protein n=1 Tax=Belliella marina TaxID=1644146 RepID=A0ABW4VLX7_9BACT
MVLRIYLILICFCQFQILLAQDMSCYYLKDKKSILTKQSGQYFVKLPPNTSKSDLHQFEINQEDILFFQNRNSFGALEIKSDDIDFSLTLS